MLWLMPIIGPSSIAYSGLKAASTRLQVSAHNVANSNTDGFDPQRVDQTALRAGGTLAQVSQPDGNNPVYMRDGSITEASNTDLVSETVDQMQASNSFKANLAVLRTSDEMVGSLFDRKI
jgi:flagellar basal-body rod protein FlgC